LENEMREGFSTIMEYLVRIDEELVSIKKDMENKVDSSAYVLLQKRVADAEKEIREIKNLLLKEKKVAA
jgi:hypothetical protein